MEQEFTILENKKIGRNFSMFRKIRDKKATEVANYIGIGEAAYTKYERGESKITIDIIQKVSEFLKVDPLHILSATPGNFIENGNHSPIAINGYNQTINEHQFQLMTKLMENVIAMNEKVMKLLDKR